MHIKPFKAIFPNLEYVTSNDSFFGSVKEDYPEYANSGFFNKSDIPAIYIYKIKGEDRQYTGIISSTKIEDYLDGLIKKHEFTIAAKEQRQLQLLLRRKAIVKPILLTYPDVPEINDLTQYIIDNERPIFDIEFEEERTQHLIWAVSNPELSYLFQDLFDKHIPYAYIADGHHRTSTNALLYQRAKTPEQKEKYNTLLSAFFPASQIDIYDFNRVVDLDDDISLSYFMARLSAIFDITSLDGPQKPRGKFEITLHLNKQECYRLEWKTEILEQYKQEDVLLDCALLDEWVLKGILQIVDLKENLQINYVQGPKGLEGVLKKVQKSERSIGFCLYPVQFEEMVTLVSSGKVLPPKSTWFEPRMKNGLVVLEF